MDIVEYKCPNCSADLTFTPQTQKLTCAYCGGEFSVKEIKDLFAKNEQNEQTEEKPKPQEKGDDFEENTKVYICKSCGAEIIADEQQTALFCYYCQNPVILSGKMKGTERPQKIIGFKIGRDEAVKKFREWCFKPFVPKDFKTEQQLEKITGLYVPFWLADCDADINYTAVGKNIRHWTSGDYSYTETLSYSINRKATVVARNVPADGSKKIDDALMESIEPFDYSALDDFSMSYLTGFYADKYDMNKESMFPRIKDRVKQSASSLIAKSLKSYTKIEQKNEHFIINNTTWQYIMLPVWFMTYKYKDRMYEFALNGQTGKIAGTPPLAHNKLRLRCLEIFAACTVAISILGGFIIGGIL